MSCKLSVNLNKIALLRNARGHNFPSVEAFAHRALQAGAHGLTIHPRPDQRHARYTDIVNLQAVARDYPGTEVNIEGYPDTVFLQQVLAAAPDQCTLVPDAPGQLTSDHGWNIKQHHAMLSPIVACLKAAGIRVSLFVDPDPAQIALAPLTGTDRIELYTQAYAASPNAVTMQPYQAAAKQAAGLGLGVNAGHDLGLQNLPRFVGSIPQLQEVSIGHALTVEALEMGFSETVRQYVQLLAAAGGLCPSAVGIEP